MSNVKAGVAYVDVRLGSIEQFKQKLKSEIQNAANDSAKKLGDDMSKKVAPEGTKVGKTMAGTFGGSFFSEAKRSFGGGFRALSQGNVSIFGSLMKRGAGEAARGFSTAFNNGLKSIPTFFSNIGKKILPVAQSIGSSIASGFTSLPSKISSAGKAVDSFSKKMGFLSFQLQNFGIIASTAFTLPVAAIVSLGAYVGLKTAAQIEQATASLKALTPAGTDVEALIKRLQALAQKSPIFNTTDVITFTQKMVASGLKVQTVEAFLKSFGNVALSVGADVGKIPFALEALVQMVGKGKVSMEELRQQLGDALPGAMKLVSDGLGITTTKLYAMVKAGDLTGEQVIAAFTKLGQTKPYLDGAAKGTDTLGSKWQALKETLQTQLGNAFLDNSKEIKKGIDDLGPALSELIKQAGPLIPTLVKGFTSFVTKLKELVDWYKNLSPAQKDMVNKFALILIAIGPVVVLLGTLGGAIAGITALIAAIATPVGLVILGLIAFGVEVFLIIKYFKDLYNEGGKFKTFWDNLWSASVALFKPVTDEFGKLKKTIMDAWNQIKNAFAEQSTAWQDLWTLIKFIGAAIGLVIAAVFSVIWGIFKGLASALPNIINIISSAISGIVKIIGGILNFLIGLFTLDFGKMSSALTSIWNGLWDLIVGTLWNAVLALGKFVKGLVTGIVDFFTWLFDVLVGHSIIPDMVNKIISWFKKMWQKGVELVKALGRPFLNFYNDHIKPFVDGVGRGVTKVLDFVKSLPEKIKGFFSKAGSWLIDAGKNIVNGLIDGVSRMGNTLKNAILNLIPGPVRSVVAKALGINSPSRVFMEYGKYTVLGFIRGVQGSSPALAGVMDGAFNFAPPSVSPSFGDARQPIVDPRGSGPALNIENYNTNDSDPDRIAEDLWFKIQSRGGGA